MQWRHYKRGSAWKDTVLEGDFILSELSKELTQLRLSEKRRVRLVELESQIRNLKLEKKEKEKMSKLKAQSDQKITALNSEIRNMKAAKVKLMRQIREENSKFQNWRKEKEREVKQLKEKDRKRQYEICKLERDFNKQKNVLRRKTEEAAAANRRLKEARTKQRMAAEKKAQSRMLGSANSRMKAWLEEDLEIAVSLKQADKHLVSLEDELRSLRAQLDEMEGKSPHKRRRTFNVDDISESERRELVNECELKEELIKEMQSKLADDKELRTRQQSRLIQITSIAEARAVMKYLFTLTVESRLSEESCRKEATFLHDEVRAKSAELHQLQKLVLDSANEKEEEIVRLREIHQEQILFLTKQLHESSARGGHEPALNEAEKLQQQIRIQANAIEELLKEKEKLEKKISASAPPKKKTKKSAPAHEELEYIEEEEDDVLMSDYDSDYVPTPRFRRKTSMLKESRNNTQETCCNCVKSRCNTKMCGCRKASVSCRELCKCNKARCLNASHVVEADSTSVASSESLNSTFVLSKSGGDEKENEAFTPYYKRMPALLSADNVTDQSPRLSSGSIYKPCYFNSPMMERNRLTANDSVKPKSVFQKKRRLHDATDMLD